MVFECVLETWLPYFHLMTLTIMRRIMGPTKMSRMKNLRAVYQIS